MLIVSSVIRAVAWSGIGNSANPARNHIHRAQFGLIGLCPPFNATLLNLASLRANAFVMTIPIGASRLRNSDEVKPERSIMQEKAAAICDLDHRQAEGFDFSR